MGFSQQQLDIIARSGSFFVDACPGAGKTHTIVERFITRPHLKDRRGIALISFTRAAADEVVTRTVDNPQLQQSPNFIGTIDTFVNRYIIGPLVAAQTGRRPTFRDAWASVPSTTLSVNTTGGAPIDLKLDDFKFAVDGSAALDLQRVYYQDRDRIAALSPHRMSQLLARASARWNKLISAGYIDCAHSRTLLQIELADPHQRARIGALLSLRFSEAIVDEFQDCNPGDLELLKMLHESGIDLVMIGDLEQSIYKFRDADPTTVRLFLDLLGKPLPLSGNYRSTPAVCSIVNSLRHGNKKDTPTGKNASSTVPVHLLPALSNLEDISAHVSPLLQAASLGREDVVYLAHPAWAAQQAAGAPRAMRSSSKLALIARAADKFRLQDAGARLKALDEIQHHLSALLPERLTDLTDTDLLAATRLTAGAFRAGLIAVATTVDARLQKPQEANRDLKAILTRIGWSDWLELHRLPTINEWPEGLIQPSEQSAWSTIHGYKGRQARAVVVVMTNTPGNYYESAHVLWERGLEGEARRTLYVGASRAEELLIMAPTKASQHQAAAASMARDGVPHTSITLSANSSGEYS